MSSHSMLTSRRMICASSLLLATGMVAAQPVNDRCDDATRIAGGSIGGTTVGATGSDISSCGFTDERDVWYALSDVSGSTLVSVSSTTMNASVTLFSECGGSEIACGSSGDAVFEANGGTVLVRVAGSFGSTGSFTLNVGEAPRFSSGADVILSDIQSTSHYGPVGSMHAYAIGSHTCNVGDGNLGWGSSWDGSPLLAMNMYRLADGRLMQIGQAWGKTGCCAAAGSGCGLPCNGNGGSVLGAGCLDVYGAGWNGGQFGLAARSNVNAYTGEMVDADGGGGSAVFKRLQVDTPDLSVDGALYFVEGVYVGVDDAPAGNAMNNASYRRVTVSMPSGDLTLQDSTVVGFPALRAWREYGNGAESGTGVADPSVRIHAVDVPGEGRFGTATKVRDNGDGTWTYDYAIFNLNSDRSGGAFSVPVAPGVTVTEQGFHDVPYHSGEPYDNTDWSRDRSDNEVRWAGQTFSQNENANALRWGTMYNFWFTADAPPVDGEVELGLFRPGTPTSVTWSTMVPEAVVACACEVAGDPDEVTVEDVLGYVALWLSKDAAAERSGDDAITVDDLLLFLDCYFQASSNGCA